MSAPSGSRQRRRSACPGSGAVTSAVQAQATMAGHGWRRPVHCRQPGGWPDPGPQGDRLRTNPRRWSRADVGPPRAGRGKVWGEELKAAGVDSTSRRLPDVVPPGTDTTNPADRRPEARVRPRSDDGCGGPTPRRSSPGMAAAGIAQRPPSTFRRWAGSRNNTDFSADVVDDVDNSQMTRTWMIVPRTPIDAHVPFVMVALATYTRIDPDNSRRVLAERSWAFSSATSSAHGRSCTPTPTR